VLLFSVAVSVVTAVVFGLAPALHASRRDVANPLRESGRGLSGGGRRQALMRNTLVVVEVALSLVLLVGASLMIRTVIALKNVDLGFQPDRLLTMRVPLAQARYPDAQRRGLFFEDLAERVAMIPGVSAVGVNTGVHPMGNVAASMRSTAVRGRTPARADSPGERIHDRTQYRGGRARRCVGATSGTGVTSRW
jgi:hypothetical protein